MSELLPGSPPAPPPARPREAAVVLLFRKSQVGLELWWQRRSPRLAYAGDYFSFPGASVEPADASVPMEGASGVDAAARVAAVRGLFAETGVLLARGAERVPLGALAELRQALVDRRLSFSALLSRHGLTLVAQGLLAAGRWVTPAFMPTRFDARYFLVEAPPGAAAQPPPDDPPGAGWVKASDALALWDSGEVLLYPAALFAFQTLSSFTNADDAASRLRSPPHVTLFVPNRIELQRGIRVFPLETATLPPATHTNCYVLGNGELLIVDPGADDVRQVARLLALMEGLKTEGKRPKAVFLTHHHSDHVGGALSVCHRLSIPLWCHERTADRLPAPVERKIADGEVITLAGLPPLRLKALHTPGHARGHVCLVEEQSGAAVVGDMVAGIGTIVIDPPEGDMADYLDQLRRLRELPVGVLYPAHGPAILDGPAKLQEYLIHREQRERLVLEATPTAGGSLAQIVAAAYADTPAFMHPLAERSALAILIKLIRENRVVRTEDRYARVT